MRTMTPCRLALGAAATALLLTACGGGGDGGPPVDADPALAGTQVPLSATTSSAGALAFVKKVAATSDDTAAPIEVGDAVLGSSDTDEPDPGI